VFDLHAIDLCRPVPIPSGHRFDDGEAGVVDSALDAAVMAQGDFTGDKFLKVVEMALTVASGMFGGRHGIFEQIAQTKAAQVVLQTGVCRNGSGMSRYSVGLKGVSFHDREASAPVLVGKSFTKLFIRLGVLFIDLVAGAVGLLNFEPE